MSDSSVSFRVCVNEGCKVRIPKASVDPHTTCSGCRRVECSIENTCNECERLSAQEWKNLTSYLKKLEKDRERKAAYKSRKLSNSSVASFSSHNYAHSISARSQVNPSNSASEMAELRASLQKMQEKMEALEGKRSECGFSSDVSVPSVVEGASGRLCDASRSRPLPSSLAQRRRKVESLTGVVENPQRSGVPSAESYTSQTARDSYRKSVLRECFSSSSSPSPRRGWKEWKLSRPLKRNWKEPELNSSPKRFSEEDAPSVIKKARKELDPWNVKDSRAPSRSPSPDSNEPSTRKILMNVQEQLASLVGVLSKEPTRKKDDRLLIKRSKYRSPVGRDEPSRGVVAQAAISGGSGVLGRRDVGKEVTPAKCLAPTRSQAPSRRKEPDFTVDRSRPRSSSKQQEPTGEEITPDRSKAPAKRNILAIRKAHSMSDTPTKPQEYSELDAPSIGQEYSGRDTPSRRLEYCDLDTPPRRQEYSKLFTPTRRQEYLKRDVPTKCQEYFELNTPNRRQEYLERDAPTRRQEYSKSVTTVRHQEYSKQDTPTRLQEYSQQDTPAKRQAHSPHEELDIRQESNRRKTVIRDSPNDKRKERVTPSPSPNRSASSSERKKSREETEEGREPSPSKPINLDDVSEDEVTNREGLSNYKVLSALLLEEYGDALTPAAPPSPRSLFSSTKAHKSSSFLKMKPAISMKRALQSLDSWIKIKKELGRTIFCMPPAKLRGRRGIWYETGENMGLSLPVSAESDFSSLVDSSRDMP
ncbi:serine/arginine repetitive matrix protein 5-like [Macrobrachium nipponense]|uniref:serine/arginine repetitive matrix protein 5-like n=1 Tax=Macrobrachium nipponense TaxID=159736 RepID=UPI0030C89B6C